MCYFAFSIDTYGKDSHKPDNFGKRIELSKVSRVNPLLLIGSMISLLLDHLSCLVEIIMDQMNLDHSMGCISIVKTQKVATMLN